LLDEIQCINELKRGSYKAFTLIYDEYADYLFNFVQRQLHDRTAARDIVQDTFLKLWINRRQLNCFGNLKGFIFAIARYRIIDTLRRQMNQPRFEEYIEHLTEEPADLSPEDIMMYDEFVGRLSGGQGTPHATRTPSLRAQPRQPSDQPSDSRHARYLGADSKESSFGCPQSSARRYRRVDTDIPVLDLTGGYGG